MPNVVVVLADQMRRDALSCAGNANVQTPNLDRLAERGVRFTAACATFPACVPFRFSLLTGEYAHSRNVPALGYRLSPAERTLGDALAVYVGLAGNAEVRLEDDDLPRPLLSGDDAETGFSAGDVRVFASLFAGVRIF